MLEWILGTVATIFGGLNLFQFFFFRSTKREFQAKALQAETEAKEARHSFLEKRIESMEKMYSQQGEILDSLRDKVLELTQENIANKQLIQQLESEKKALSDKVEKLEAEVEAYKTLRSHGKD